METKICCECKKSLPIENFWIRRKKTKISRQTMCKDCSKIRRKKYHIENLNKEKEVKKKREKQIKDWYLDYKKSLKCEKCDDKRFYVLEFHHKYNKKENISGMLKFSIDAIKRELEKCTCLCANCHRELHYMGVSSSG